VSLGNLLFGQILDARDQALDLSDFKALGDLSQHNRSVILCELLRGCVRPMKDGNQSPDIRKSERAKRTVFPSVSEQDLLSTGMIFREFGDV